MLITQKSCTNIDHIIKIYGCLMQKEWTNIDLNVIGIIKQLLTLFLGYMMFGKCRGCIVNPWLLMLPSSFALG